MAPKKKQKTSVGQASAHLVGATSANDLSTLQKLALQVVKGVTNDLQKANGGSLPARCAQNMENPLDVLNILKELLNKAEIDMGPHEELITSLKSFPPAPGEVFKTNPLLWNFTAEDTWWHGEPDCEHTISLVNSMISTEFLQDHPIQCRYVADGNVVPNTHLSMLKHGPGQQRSLAAFVALTAYMTAMAENPHLSADEFTHPLVRSPSHPSWPSRPLWPPHVGLS